MAALKFVDYQSMVAYLEQPTDSDDFTEIVDFLNANPIRYALTVNPTIYVHALRSFVYARPSILKMRIGTECLPTRYYFGKLELIRVCAVWKRAAHNASSLEAEQVSGNITKTRSKATLNEPTPQGTGAGSGPRNQDTIGDTIAQTRFENVSKTSYDSPLGGVNTPQSDEDSIQLKELMEMCTNLLQRVQDLKTTKTTQAKEITSLKKRANKLEQKGRSRNLRLKRLYKVGTSRRVESLLRNISLVHKDVGIQGRFDDEDMFDTSVFNNKEVFAGQDMADQEVNVAEKEVSAACCYNNYSDMPLVRPLIEIRVLKPKAIGVLAKAKCWTSLESNTFMPMGYLRGGGSKGKSSRRSEIRVEESSKESGEETCRESIRSKGRG
ncbi:hypothetical protein Tco_1438367 [Tanacetum coccineum]